MTRLLSMSLAAAALALGAATAASAQRPVLVMPPAPAHNVVPGAACSLYLVQTYGSRQLIARAAPGITGSWSMQARAPGINVDQSGPVNGGQRVQELSRITIDAQLRPAVNHGAAGLYGAVPGPSARSVSAVLIVRNASGRVICRATPQLRQGY